MAISHIFSHGFCHLRRQVDLCNDGPVTVELSGTKAVAGARRSAVARLGRLGGAWQVRPGLGRLGDLGRKTKRKDWTFDIFDWNLRNSHVGYLGWIRGWKFGF